MRIANRFVPFARFGGSPKKINRGRVRNEPPPAKIFINPAPAPIDRTAIILNKVIFSNMDAP